MEFQESYYPYKLQRLDWFDDNEERDVWKGSIHFKDETELESMDNSMHISEEDLIFLIIPEIASLPKLG